MAAGGGNSSGSAWRMEDLQELALADDLQSGLHLSGINTDFNDILTSLIEAEGTQGLLHPPPPSIKPDPSSSCTVTTATPHDEIQCVLRTPTAHTVKLEDPVVSYVNRGQAYELVMTHEPSSVYLSNTAAVYKTMLCISFHDIKLKNCEQQLVEEWVSGHPGDRMVTLDQLSCDGVSDVCYPDDSVVGVVFNWSHRAVVAVRIHCLSTEFTEKKHGGERGVPLQLLLTTWSPPTDSLVDQSYCLIKVFKDKGADRKQKAEQQKSEKLPPSELQRYRPSQPHTELQSTSAVTSSSSTAPLAPPTHTPVTSPYQLSFSSSTPTTSFSSPQLPHQSSSLLSPNFSPGGPAPFTSSPGPALSASSHHEVQEWLATHRFTSLQPTFTNYTGEDLFRLSRKDLMELCAPAEGIRLFNSLHSRTVRTLYVRLQHESVYQVVCLDQLTANELCHQLALRLNISPTIITGLLRRVVTFLVKIDDTVVQNINEEQCFVIEVVKAEKDDSIQLVLTDPSDTSPQLNQ